jgi:single-stranded DNA-binding protein
MSINQDCFTSVIVGNLISEPNLVEDEDGNKVCYCKVATNSKARKFDPKTGRELSPDERNKRRSFVELKIAKTAAAEKFAQLFSQGDRIRCEGEMGTRRVKKAFWSIKDEKYVSVSVDVDNDKKNIQEVLEDRLMMWVEEFAKVITAAEGNYLVHT